MSKSRKWKIKGLAENLKLSDSAKIVLKQRIDTLTKAVKKFFEDETIENLHDVRIALRRVRYNMEVFEPCFPKKKFSIFYKVISNLQDRSGSKRDLDVLIENVNTIKSNIDEGAVNLLKNRVEEKKSEINDALKLELFEFLHGKELKDFNKLIS